MDDLGITPPSAPGAVTEKRTEKRPGFFSKFFKKKKDDDARMTHASLDTPPQPQSDVELNLDDIRKKAGLEPVEVPAKKEEPIVPHTNETSTAETPVEPSQFESTVDASFEEIPDIEIPEPASEPPDALKTDVLLQSPSLPGAKEREEQAKKRGLDAAIDEPEDETEPMDWADAFNPPTSLRPVAEPEASHSSDDAGNEKKDAEETATPEKDTHAWDEPISHQGTDEAPDKTSHFAAETVEAHAEETPSVIAESAEEKATDSSHFTAENTDDAWSDIEEPEASHWAEHDLEELDRVHAGIASRVPSTDFSEEADDGAGTSEELVTDDDAKEGANLADEPLDESSPDEVPALDDTEATIDDAMTMTVEDEKGAKPVEKSEPESDADELPEHHKIAEKAFAQLEKKHKALDKQLAKIVETIPAEVPEWKLQKVEVTPDKYFTLKNGQEIKSFKDLLEALSFIDDETFAHHVTEDRNDFAAWVQHVLQEEELANRIRNKTAREQLLSILEKHEQKVMKDLEKKWKKLERESGKREEKSEKMRELEQRLEKMAEELMQKSDELQALRTKTGERLKKHLDMHIEQCVAEERERINIREQELDDRQHALDEQEADRKAEQENLDAQRTALDEERSLIERQRTEAEALVAQAEEIRLKKEEMERVKGEAAATFAHIEQAEKEAERLREETAEAQEQLKRERVEFQKEKDDVREQQRGFAKREAALKRSMEAAEKEKEKMAAEREKMAAERKSTKEFIKDEMGPLEKKRKEIEKLIKQMEKKTKEEAARRKKHEKIVEELGKREKSIKRREADVEDRFEEFEAAPEVDAVANVDLYRLIDECKVALKKKDVKEARSKYNSLRDGYAHAKLSSHEKSLLYNSIRELYDDIHLAMLNQ